MLKNIQWDVIKGEFDKAKSTISDNTPICLTITPKFGEPLTRKILFGQFLEAMWRIYDSHTEIMKVNAQSKGGLSFFEYDVPTTQEGESKPTIGNGNIILEFKNFTTTQREVHITLLLTQILEDHSCTQNNSTPPNGNPS